MIELTVKTLDSNNHKYSVPDEITVKAFKDTIATSVGITADKQRLIYCGRVLQDDKKLSEYDVNGKVVHLVQRPPPNASSPSTNNGSSANSASDSRSARRQPQRSGAQEGNGYLLGAFTVPSNVVDPNHVQQIVQQVVTGMGELGRNATIMSRASDDGSTVDVHINLNQAPARSETNQRLLSARSMIRRAGECVNRMQNSSAARPNVASAAQPETERARDREGEEEDDDDALGSGETPSPTAEENVVEANLIVEADDFDVDMADAIPFVGASGPPASGAGVTASGMADAARVAAAAVFAAAAQSSSSSAASSTATTPPVGTADTSPLTEVRVDPEGSTGDTPARDATAASTTASFNGSTNRSSRPQVAAPPRATALSDVLDDIAAFHARFGPYLDRLRAIIREDRDYQLDARPGVESPLAPQRIDAQNVFNNVSRVLHLLSHAYHAVSDVVLNFSQPPPRTLHSRVLVVQQPAAAIVQAAIPVQAQISISTTLSTTRSTTTNSNSENGSATVAASTPSTADVTSQPTTTNAGATPTAIAVSQNGNANAAAAALSANPMAGLIGTANPFVFMEIMPNSSITIDGVTADVNADGSDAPARNAFPSGRFSQMVLPQGQTQDFLRNLMQAVSHGMAGQRTAGNGAAGGQSQARGNTATQPTTSTQTRSTSRPIQTIPMPFPGFSLPSFDQFLPCTSRHIYSSRSSLRRSAASADVLVGQIQQPQQSQPSQPANDSSSSNNNATNTNANANGFFSGLIANMLSSLLPRTADVGTSPTQQTATAASPAVATAAAASNNGTASREQTQVPSTPPPPPITRPAPAPPVIQEAVLSSLMNSFGLPAFAASASSSPAPGPPPQVQPPSQSAAASSQRPSMLDFLRTFERFNEGGEGLLNDLLMCVTRHLTILEFVLVCGGRLSPLDQLRVPLRNFVRAQVRRDDNGEVTDDDIRIVVRDITDNVIESVHEAVGAIQIRDGVDYMESVRRFSTVWLEKLIRLILTSPAENFGTSLYNACHEVISLFIRLHLYCLNEGAAGFDRMVHNAVIQSASDLDSAVGEYVLGLTTSHIQSMVSNLTNTEEDIQQYIVRTTITTPTGADTVPSTNPPPTPLRTDDHRTTSSVEAMDVAPSEPEPILVQGLMGPAGRAFAPPSENFMNEDEAISDAVWQNTVPTEWVPIIAEDVQRQRRAASQRPFSDGYIASMPSKRRKVIAENRIQVIADSLLPDVLTRAVASAGVRPTTSIESVVHEVASSATLQSAFQDHMNAKIRRRLAEDQDYVPGGKFPATDALFGTDKSKPTKDF